MKIRVITALIGAAAIAACATPTAISQTETAAVTDTAPELTLERLYASPGLSGPSPRGVKFSPDGARVTFLKPRESDGARFDLWQFDVATGAQSMLVDSMLLEPEEVELSEEEKALRERRRIAGSRGIVDYDWGTPDTILVPIGGDLHLVTLDEAGADARQLTDTEAFEYDARVSPDGSRVSFVRDGAVYAIDLESGAEQRLTPLAAPDSGLSFGVAEFVAQEEMSRYTGYWWSPDGRYLAYTRVDENPVDIIPRFDIAADEVTVIEQRYPRAGRPNAIVDLLVRDMDTGEAVQIDWRRDDWGPATDQYLARVYFKSGRMGGQGVFIGRVNRDQTEYEMTVVRMPDDGGLAGMSRTPGHVRSETHETWFNLTSDFDTSAYMYTLTEEAPGGHRRILASRADGRETFVPLTPEDWVVSELLGVFEDEGIIAFTGFGDTPLERHLYTIPIDGGDPVRVTQAGKSWSITMASDGRSFVGTSSSPTQPPQTGLYRMLSQQEKFDAHRTAGGGAQSSDTQDCEDLVPGTAALQIYCGPQAELIAWIEENALDADHPYAPYLADHTVPEYGTLSADDGQTLHYSIQTPPDFDPTQQYPVLVNVYGGPHVQTVNRNWERMDDQFYTRRGYVVFRLDNRGSFNRGKTFEDVIYRRTGGPEVADQLVGVDWLKSQPFVDPDRIAMQGWSYGGYMTLMTILQAPEGTFAAAVSGAPVTDWSLYDTFYTERYMDTPQDNADGYEASSVFPYVDNLTTPLLLIHGMADDNVTFDNTTRLMAALQEAGKTFELMTYPGQRHGIRGQALQTHLMRTRMAFLDRQLRPGE